MAECYYRLNGDLLRTDTIRDVIIEQDTESKFRQESKEVNNSREINEDLDPGEALAETTLKFHLYGDQNNPTDEINFIYDQIKNSPFTISAEATNKNRAIWREHDRVACAAQTIRQIPKKSYAFWVLELEILIQGIWIADGGDYHRRRNGFFKQQSDGTFDTEDGTNVNATEIQIPEQTTDYPKARRTSDDQRVSLSAASTTNVTTRDGQTRTEEVYDLSGFLWPSDPSTTGDVGEYSLLTSPTQDYLDATT